MKEKLRASMPLLGFLLCPVVTMILTELYTHDPFQDMKKTPWILNIAGGAAYTDIIFPARRSGQLLCDRISFLADLAMGYLFCRYGGVCGG